MCMLNGRFDNDQDNFTSVSTKASAVVDYCIVTHSNFSQFSDFRVTSTNDLINSIPALCRLTSSGIPDHSLLTWKIETCDLQKSYDNGSLNEQANYYDRFDLTRVPDSFLSSEESLTLINSVMSNLEQGLQSQADIDNFYGEWCDLVKHNMYASVPYKRVVTQGGTNTSKKRKPGKPWWSNKLIEM